MRDDGEFSAWLNARWPDLVRSLVFLGHPPEDAERIALDAFSRLLPGWGRLRREEDVDVALYREVLDSRSRARSPDGASAAVATDVAPGLSEQAERREEVATALAAMDARDREAVVLMYLAELSQEQVADVTGDPGPDGTTLPAEDVRFAAEAVPVSVVQTADVREHLRARRRRVLRRGAGAVAVLVVVATALTWFLGRTDELAGVAPETNPLPIAWYADDTLHLAEVTVEVEGVERLVSVGGGVVLSDDEGQVLMVAADGRRQSIGETVPGSPLVVDADNGWVAWADPGAGTPELVVHDTGSGQEVDRRSLAVPGAGDAQPVADSRAIAIDGERVYYAANDTDFAWQPLMGSAAFAVAGSLRDTAGGARLSDHQDGLMVQAAPFRVGKVIPAERGTLTRDGRYVFAEDDFEEMEVYDVATGEPIDRMYSPSDVAVAWGYVDDGSFLFAVLHKLQDKTYQDMLQMPSEGNLRVYHCDPGRPDPCERVLELPEDVADAPIFAR